MNFNKKFSIFNLLFKWKRIKVLMYVVEYQTSSMIQSQKFVYTYAEENPYARELKFENEVSGQTLALNKDRLEYYITREINEN